MGVCRKHKFSTTFIYFCRPFKSAVGNVKLYLMHFWGIVVSFFNDFLFVFGSTVRKLINIKGHLTQLVHKLVRACSMVIRKLTDIRKYFKRVLIDI